MSSIRSGNGSERFFRLRTSTAAGVLHTASMTLRADTLRPIEGHFDFAGEPELTISNAGEEPVLPPSNPKRPPSRSLIETRATPEDELRVFAALNELGADAGEPVTVGFDASRRHVVVEATGVSPDRQHTIAQALRMIPAATTRFENAPAQALPRSTKAGEEQAVASAVPLRQEIERRAGGAQKLEEITGRAFDASGTLLAHAHALAVLSNAFPPGVESSFNAENHELLLGLRRGHAATVLENATSLRHTLRPLLAASAISRETARQPEPSWHSGAAELLTSGRTLDRDLSQLLAGSYTQESGTEILRRLPAEIDRIEALAHEQEIAP